MTYTTALVLRALSRGHRHGFDVMRVAELPSGTVYPILRRIEAAGLVKSRWEEADPSEEGRPRRRYYEITPDGRLALAEAVERFAAAEQRLFGTSIGAYDGSGR
jgi:DNA-binding PadR family transcriptional regulator